MVSIKTADLKQDFKSIADSVVGGERVLISRPKNENLILITETEFNKLEKLRIEAEKREREDFCKLIDDMRGKAAESGFLTDEEINAEIQAVRIERKVRG